jgi:NMD protein affecting ribosome stability and mRNA decay
METEELLCYRCGKSIEGGYDVYGEILCDDCHYEMIAEMLKSWE